MRKMIQIDVLKEILASTKGDELHEKSSDDFVFAYVDTNRGRLGQRKWNDPQNS